MKEKILYFDDDEFISNLLKENLVLNGYDVTLTSSIDDLFQLLDNSSYDLLIIDIMSPIPSEKNDNVTFSKDEIELMDEGMNTGVILAEKIWKMPNYSDIPILFLSAKGPGSVAEIEDNKNFEYLRKPELVVTIIEKIKLLLDRKIR